MRTEIQTILDRPIAGFYGPQDARTFSLIEEMFLDEETTDEERGLLLRKLNDLIGEDGPTDAAAIAEARAMFEEIRR